MLDTKNLKLQISTNISGCIELSTTAVFVHISDFAKNLASKKWSVMQTCNRQKHADITIWIIAIERVFVVEIYSYFYRFFRTLRPLEDFFGPIHSQIPMDSTLAQKL